MEMLKSPRTSYRIPKKRPSKKTKAGKLNYYKTREKQCELPGNPIVVSVSTEPDSSNQSDSFSTVSHRPTASERKLYTLRPTQKENVHDSENNIPKPRCSAAYTLVHSSVWKQLFQGLLCGVCKSHNINVDITENLGFCSKLIVKCVACENISSQIYTSPRIRSDSSQRAPFDVNKRMVDSFLAMGKGHAAMQTFSMNMGMNAMGSRPYSELLNRLVQDGQVLKTELFTLNSEVVRTAYVESDPSLKDKDVIDIYVSYDGTFHKRGHISNHGIGIVIDVMTGIVLDYEILSKFCGMCVSAIDSLGANSQEYRKWYEDHLEKGHCQKNYNGSSNAMEKDAAEILWRRSVQNRKFRYTEMLSDGDAKTHIHLNKIKVYGSDMSIVKQECINHVSKRLGTALRKLVKESRSKGVTLGGKKKGSLKETMIKKLTSYYRKAIADNINDVENMKNAIYATLRHYISTDDNPQHTTCPKGIDSWCWYNRQVVEGCVDTHSKRKVKLSENIDVTMMPIYQRLAATTLLERCAKGKTQNANESLHHVIWNKCPKEVFVSKNKLDLAVTRAISEFNMGSVKSLELQHEVRGDIVVDCARKISVQRDTNRIIQSKKRSSTDEKEQLKKRKMKKNCRRGEEEEI
ncbi:uncharacterized protein [Periplaneta americana]|uniref:uncharacterized protein n=1 Tax=Periplaneta americana TaxID=6978 RepID=UPI0037E7701E